MNENVEGAGPLTSGSSKLLSGVSLLQIHVNSSKSLPKDGSKEFSPSNTWMEKKQIQSALDERKELLEEERVDKWSCLAGATWDHKKKLAEVTRRIGKYFQTLGFEKEGILYLYPEEALYLLEMNCLELTFGGVPLSIQQGYSLLLGTSTGCNLHEYRTYSHLVRQGYKLLRCTNQQFHTKYERTIRLDQHAPVKRSHPGHLEVKCEISSVSKSPRIKSEGSPAENIGNQCNKEALKQERTESQSFKESSHVCGNSIIGQEEMAGASPLAESGKILHSTNSVELNQTKSPNPGSNHEEDSLKAEESGPVNKMDMRKESLKVHKDSEGLLQELVDSNENGNESNEGKSSQEEDRQPSEELMEPNSCQGNCNTHKELLEKEKSGGETKLPDENPRGKFENLEINSVTQSVSEDTQPESPPKDTNKAYDIAESLLSLGSVLMEKETSSETREAGTNRAKDLSFTLHSEIMKVLGAHFEKGVSEEALSAVASSAADTILSHISPSVGNQASLSHHKNTEPVIYLGDEASSSECELLNVPQAVQNSGDISDGQDCSIQENAIAASELNQTSTSEAEQVELIPSNSISDVNDSYTPDQKLSPKLKKPSKVEEFQSQVKKRPVSVDEEMDDCEPILIKKAKVMDVADAEIEIIDFVPDKKEVELVNLSDESSLDSMKESKSDSDEDSGDDDDDSSSIEVIDVHDSSSNESSDTSGESDSGTDSSVILEEKRSINRDEERRRILDTIPNMYNMSEISIEPPSEDLLPHNVQPQHSKYVISRWKLNKESKQIKSGDHPDSGFHPQSQPLIRPPCNYLPQGMAPHQLWQQNVPINPVAAVQAIAQLVLPMLGLPPTSFPPEQVWMPNNSWFPPRPAWNHGPRFNHRPPRGNHWQRFRPRPYGFRHHHNPRYQRRGSNQYRSSHVHYQNNVTRMQLTDYPLRNELVPLQTITNTENEDSYSNENCNSTQRPSNWNSWMQQNKFQNTGKVKRLQKRGLTRSRYFNPPRKYTHMHVLGADTLDSQSLKSDDSSVICESTKYSSVKCELDSNEEESANDSSCVQNLNQTTSSSSDEDSDNVQSSCNNSPLEARPLLSPEDCTSFGAVFKTLQVIKNADTETLVSTVCERSLKPQFDLFSPAKPFKKGNLPVPDFHLCVMGYDDAVPNPGEIRALINALDDHVPVMFAIVSLDSISFFQFCDVNLPALTAQI